MKLPNVNPDILSMHQSLNRNDRYYLSRDFIGPTFPSIECNSSLDCLEKTNHFAPEMK